MNFFIIAMPGCGNLGDDLISEQLQLYLNKHFPDSKSFLIGLDESKFNVLERNELLLVPRNRPGEYLSRYKKIICALNKCDYIIIGGGGLIQDTHSLFTPHSYLKWLIFSNKPVSFVGVGVGPMKHYFNKRYVKWMLNKKNITIQVRDKDSKRALESYGVKNSIHVGCDIIVGSKIYNRSSTQSGRVLGCSLRPWIDLDSNKLIVLLRNIIRKLNVDKVLFFVFEYQKEATSEYDFQKKLVSQLKEIETEVLVYGINPDFFIKFYSVSWAIASRYHANVLWQKAGVPVMPIPYAPKVYSLYGEDCVSLEGFDSENFKESFYKLKMDYEYHMPDLENVSEIPYSYRMKLLNYCLIVANTLYTITRSILLRISNKLK